MMIKRTKKKWKSKRPEGNKIKPAECTNQSRNSLTSSNQSSGGKERQSRNPKRMKSSNNRSRCLWHRSKSVPSKTVSFSPYVLHRFTQGPHRVKADACRTTSCAGCKHKTGAKRPLAIKKRLTTERSCQHQHEPDPILPAENVSTNFDSFHGARSPGPAKCGIDHLYPDCDYHTPQCSGPVHFFHPELPDKSPAPKYRSYMPQESNPSVPHGTASSVGSAYIGDFGSNRSPWYPVKRSLHSTPVVRNRGADAKYDFLMAKYSEHNCPKTHPALSDYFSFQKLSLDGSQNMVNLSQNKSPSVHLAGSASAPPSHPRSHSRTRSEQMPRVDPARPSVFQYENKYYTGFNAPYKYSSGRYSSADLYQSEAMRDLMYSTVSQKYIDKPSAKGSSHIRSVRPDPDMNPVFQRRRLSGTSFPFQKASSAIGTKLGVSLGGSSKYEFFDDMCLMRRYHNLSKNTTLLTGVRSGATQRSRSSDASFMTGLSSYDDKEMPAQGRFGLDSGGEYKNSDGEYKNSGGEYKNSGNRQHGHWVSSYGKTEGWKNSLGNQEHWKDTYGIPDDAISSSKYADRSYIRRSSCVNNSNERVSHYLQAAELMFPTNSSYSSGWSTLKKRSALYSDSKSVDNDTFLSRFDELENRRPYDKYACWGNAKTSASEHANRILKDDSKDADAKTFISGPGREYSTLTSLAGDKGLGPATNRRLFGSNRGNFNSFPIGNELSFEVKDSFGKHHNSSVGFDQLPIASECKMPTHDSNSHSRNYSYLGARNLNMNKSQSTGIKTEFQPSSAASLNQSWKFHSGSDYSRKSDSASDGPTKTNACQLLAAPQSERHYSSYFFDSSACMLNSLVDQETDRLKKLAGVIERQQDVSQDVNNDIVF